MVDMSGTQTPREQETREKEDIIHKNMIPRQHYIPNKRKSDHDF